MLAIQEYRLHLQSAATASSRSVVCSAELAGEREQQHQASTAEAQAQVQHLQQELAHAKRQLHESQELAEGQLQVGLSCWRFTSAP